MNGNLIKLQYAKRRDPSMRAVRQKKANIKKANICNKLDYLNGLPDQVITEIFQEAVRKSISEAKENGFPVAMYDKASKRAYLEFPDGRREYK